MDMLEITISVTLQVRNSGDKLSDCLSAIDEAKNLLNKEPGYKLLRESPRFFGAPKVEVTKLRRVDRGGILDGSSPAPPLSIITPIE